MQKMDGKICDSCRKLFYPEDKIYEFCHECANLVWCVTNVYKDGSKELSSIHHTEDGAIDWVSKNKQFIEEMNVGLQNPIVDQEITNWMVL